MLSHWDTQTHQTQGKNALKSLFRYFNWEPGVRCQVFGVRFYGGCNKAGSEVKMKVYAIWYSIPRINRL